jgi:ubiquinone/menaquinone biosynthesis C-methylase UbiE
MESSKHFVAGYSEEEKLDKTAQKTIRVLQETTGVQQNDTILEIGCGVGRVGKPLSKLCEKWIGADISGNMLSHARDRLDGLANVEFVELSEVGLKEIPDESIDLVYCTVVFMHLYEWDRYKYVEEAYRVLKPHGRCLFDNVDLATDVGWEVFQEGYKIPTEERPAHLSMVSTGEELENYLIRANFNEVQLHKWSDAWVGAHGKKAERSNS